MKTIQIHENDLYLVILINDSGQARLVHFSALPYDPERVVHLSPDNYNLLEMQCTGCDISDHHGSRYTGTNPAARLVYVSHRLLQNRYGKKLEILLADGGLEVTAHYQFYQGISVVRTWNEVYNHSGKEVSLEYISSFAYYGLSKEGLPDWTSDSYLYIPHNTWHGELQWRRNLVNDLGLEKLNKSSVKRLSYMQQGTWSSSEYLPMGIYENTTAGTLLFWQIEHNGSWYWECGDVEDSGLYLQLGGPNNNQHHFRKVLRDGERFETVKAAVGVTSDSFDKAIGELTKYRRTIRRKNEDNEKLPVIFNDYMNCLMGDPSTQKLMPLIDSAAEAGCEYFVIDAGWYSDIVGNEEGWWSTVGEWKESHKRFPNGLGEIMDHIRSKGMVPGLWVEIEVMGIECPAARRLPDSWFFMRNGYRVIDHQRYQLDFRNPEVRSFATGVIDRLVREYGIGYLKMDYNINAGIGTDYQADSAGEGLLQHNRALLCWLDEQFERHPGLVIENCGSGGMRMDYAMLQRMSIQSTSDQTDYRQYASISSMAASAVVPEQAAVWSYPCFDSDREQTVFNMVNALLGRVHQSGFLYRLDQANFALVKQGIALYKTFRMDIKKALPLFPLGLVRLHSPWACGGLDTGEKVYLSVWRMGGEDNRIFIPLPVLRGKDAEVRYVYPDDSFPLTYKYHPEESNLEVMLPEKFTARFFEISYSKHISC